MELCLNQQHLHILCLNQKLLQDMPARFDTQNEEGGEGAEPHTVIRILVKPRPELRIRSHCLQRLAAAQRSSSSKRPSSRKRKGIRDVIAKCSLHIMSCVASRWAIRTTMDLVGNVH